MCSNGFPLNFLHIFANKIYVLEYSSSFWKLELQLTQIHIYFGKYLADSNSYLWVTSVVVVSVLPACYSCCCRWVVSLFKPPEKHER